MATRTKNTKSSSGQAKSLTSLTIRDLLSFKIHDVANEISRGAAKTYRAMGITLMEWRVIAHLGGFAPLRPIDIARYCNMHKSLASRVVSDLVARGLVIRRAGHQDQREVALELSEAGKKTYQRLMEAAGKRHAAFTAALTDLERAYLEVILLKLLSAASEQTRLASASQPEEEE